MNEQTPLIHFQNVSVRRGETLALNRLNLTIHAGEHVAILGPNGSGKSTLIKVITRECYPLRIDPPATVRIFGKEVWNVFQLREQLGIVSNDLIDLCKRGYKSREVILSGFFSSIGLQPYYRPTAEMEEETARVMKLLEVEHLARRWTDELSSGELRRVVIGRALVHNPKALVLDEPSNSLDVRAAGELRDTLRMLASNGMSIIMVTHHLPDLIPEIQRVVLIRDGQVHREGTKEELLRDTILSELFGVPVTLGRRDGYYHLMKVTLR
jgi:iron complex transport system ATP-binding protein